MAASREPSIQEGLLALNARAWGIAFGLLLGGGLFLATNFLVIKGSDDCPTDLASNPVGGDFINTNTVQHQPPLSGYGSHSFKCTNSSCSGANKVKIEPDLANEAVQMVCPATVDGCT